MEQPWALSVLRCRPTPIAPASWLTTPDGRPAPPLPWAVQQLALHTKPTTRPALHALPCPRPTCPPHPLCRLGLPPPPADWKCDAAGKCHGMYMFTYASDNGGTYSRGGQGLDINPYNGVVPRYYW